MAGDEAIIDGGKLRLHQPATVQLGSSSDLLSAVNRPLHSITPWHILVSYLVYGSLQLSIWRRKRDGRSRFFSSPGVFMHYAVVTHEIKLFSNNFEIISVLYFTCNYV